MLGSALRCVVSGAWWGGVGCAKEHGVHPATSASPRTRPTRRMHERLLPPVLPRTPHDLQLQAPAAAQSMLPCPTGSRAPAPTVTPCQGANVPMQRRRDRSPIPTRNRAPAPTAARPGARPQRRPHTSPSPTSPPPGARHELATGKNFGNLKSPGSARFSVFCSCFARFMSAVDAPGPARRPPRLIFSRHWMLAWRVVRGGGELQPPGQRRHLVPVLGLGFVPGVPIVATAPARASAQEGVNAERRGRARVVALRVTSARGNGWTAPDPYTHVFATGVTASVGRILVFFEKCVAIALAIALALASSFYECSYEVGSA
jgi:hypothetical protein